MITASALRASLALFALQSLRDQSVAVAYRVLVSPSEEDQAPASREAQCEFCFLVLA